MKRGRYLAGLVIALVGCSPVPGGILGAAFTQAEEEESRLDILEKRIGDVRNFQTEQIAQLESVEEEVRLLSSKLEELTRLMNHEAGGAGRSPEARGQLNTLTPIQPSFSGRKSPIQRGEGRGAPSRVLYGDSRPPAIVPLSVLQSDEAKVEGRNDRLEVILDESFRLIRIGEFEEANYRLNEALESDRSERLTPIAQFWKGVALEGLGRNGPAVVAYSRLISEYPTNDRTPLVLLRQASVLIRLRDFEAARVTLKKLVKDHPVTRERTQAEEKLKDLPEG